MQWLEEMADIEEEDEAEEAEILSSSPGAR